MNHEVNGEENSRKTGRKNDTGYGLERIQTRKRILGRPKGLSAGYSWLHCFFFREAREFSGADGDF